MKSLCGTFLGHCPALLVLELAACCRASLTCGEKRRRHAGKEPAARGRSAGQAEIRRQYDLRYKLKRGDVLRYDVTHQASIRSTIDKTTQAAQTKTDSVKAWKVTDVLPNGDIEFMNVVERVHMVNQLPDKDPTEYDSTRDKTPPPGFEDAAKAVGVPLSVMRITPQGKDRATRRERSAAKAAEDDAPIVLRLPEKPVAIGDTWDEPFEVQVLLQDEGNKTIQTRRHHKLTDVKNGIATIRSHVPGAVADRCPRSKCKSCSG